MKLVGLFAGIGGLEHGLAAAGLETVAVSENDPHACLVLKRRLVGVPNLGDIRALKALPACDLVACGFPCQDLSSAGSVAGIEGKKSSLVKDVWRLLRNAKRKPRWLLFENVPFMLSLHKGAGIALLTREIEALGYRWAYRVIDSRAFGLAQRRRRVFVLASRDVEPARLLFKDDGASREPVATDATACGFYWTEGNRGVGWAVDAIPPLKGTSGVSIVSPPAVWRPVERDFVTPKIADAEALQGFRRHWTKPAEELPKGERVRWRLVGNAVSVPVAKWLGTVIDTEPTDELPTHAALAPDAPWPTACFGGNGKRNKVIVSEWPGRRQFVGLDRFLSSDAPSLSLRAAQGFFNRLEKSGLRVPEQFREDLRAYCENEASPSTGRSDKQAHVADGRSEQRSRKGIAVSTAS